MPTLNIERLLAKAREVLGLGAAPEAPPPCPQVGDFCNLRLADGMLVNPQPYLLIRIEPASDGQAYGFFLETDTGWPLVQCEHADPPAPGLPPDDGEVC